MLNKFTKKTLIFLLVGFISVSFFSNCFGEFALTRTFYHLNKSNKMDGHPYVRRTVRTALMVVLSPAYFFSGLFDLSIFNVIEFWRDKNPLCNYEDEVCYVYYEKENKKMTFKYSDFGKKLTITSSDLNQNLVLFKNQPNKFYTEEEGVTKELNISSEKIQDKTILKLTKNGKLNSTRVISTEELTQLENSIHHKF
jgi:hypothetical protein